MHPGVQLDNGVTKHNILKAEAAGDEAGMMKCLFHLQDRLDCCKVLCCTTKESLRTELMSALQLAELGDGDVEARPAQLPRCLCW